MKIVYCRAKGCKYNKDQVCQLEELYIGAYHTDPKLCRSFELKDHLRPAERFSTIKGQGT